MKRCEKGQVPNFSVSQFCFIFFFVSLWNEIDFTWNEIIGTSYNVIRYLVIWKRAHWVKWKVKLISLHWITLKRIIWFFFCKRMDTRDNEMATRDSSANSNRNNIFDLMWRGAPIIKLHTKNHRRENYQMDEELR